MSSKKDLEKVEKRESYFSTLAKKEGKGAAQRAKSESKKGYTQSAKDSRMETKIDNQFAVKRKKIAETAKQKLRNKK